MSWTPSQPAAPKTGSDGHAYRWPTTPICGLHEGLERVGGVDRLGDSVAVR